MSEEVSQEDTRPLLFFSVLTGGGKVWEDHAASREALRTACAQAGVHLIISRNGGTGVDRSRNIEVANARRWKNPKRPTHFMFCDDDIAFDPKWVLDMIFSGLDIVGGAYPRKEIDYKQLHAAVRRGVEPEELYKYSTTFILNGFLGKGRTLSRAGENGEIVDTQEYVEVEELGTGFLMCKMEVLDKYIETYEKEISYITDYEPRGEVHHMVFKCDRDPRCDLEQAKRWVLRAASLQDPEDMLAAANAYREALEKGKDAYGRYLTEDYNFLIHCKQMGYKVYLYLQANLGHWGVARFDGHPKIGMQLKVEDMPSEEVKEESK